MNDENMRESKSVSIGRAYGAVKHAKTTVALYWAADKLHSSMPEAAMHERRLAIHGENLIGVYEKGVNFDLVVQDIEEFY